MTLSLSFFVLSCAATAAFLWFYVRPTLSLSSTALSLLLFFHGPAFWYYTRRWALGEGSAFDLYREAWPEHSGAGDALHTASSQFYSSLSAAVRNTEVMQSLDFAVGLTFACFCLGIWLTDRILKCPPRVHDEALRRWHEQAFLPMAPHRSKQLLSMTGLAFVVLLYFFFHDNQLPKVYVYFATAAGEFEKIAMRREMGGSPSYLFNLLLSTLLPFVAFALWTWWREGGGKGVGGLATAMLVLVVTAKLATLSKAPAAIFVLQLMALEIARGSLDFTVRQAITLGLVALTLFSIMTFVANSDLGGARESLLFLFYRVCMIPNESLVEYFAIFPGQLPHTLGNDIRWLAILKGVEPLQPSFWRVAELMRGAPGSTTTAMFMADAWAAFSWAGIVTCAFIFGCLLRWIDVQLIVKRGRTGTTIAGLGLGHHGVFIGMSTAFQTSLLTGGLLLIVPMVALLECKWPWPERGHADHD
ncbi:oligosaccharide repeat unit polymerase [Hydrogenophaga crocea]|uniref:Oligosaccharide repeat unit polymerase n=1 Tax=Hydrogenophaga crocea TaxID=2716225 RepID=A0A6G8ILK9_9BURK|nr:oligosaccharide repeat unit polymerase [Hydrogenophaga crocea]QIM53983.1 oligosaccharide repeat unit polymerase [Hydrogenophaga crocea]